MPLEAGDQWAQPQPAPQPPAGRAGAGAGIAPDRPDDDTDAKTDSSRVVSVWPSGQSMGAAASLMDRRASNRLSQVRHRYS